MITPNSLDVSALPSVCLTHRAGLPTTAAIYFAIDSLGQIQYIGQSVNLRQRWANHHRQSQLDAIGNINIAWLEISDPSLLQEIEEALIEHFDPPFNGLLKNKNLAELSGVIKWRLAVLMADREVDYRELAEMTGLHPVTVSKHKNMRVMPSRLEHGTLFKYCEALKCQPGDLLVFVPEPSGEVVQ